MTNQLTVAELIRILQAIPNQNALVEYGYEPRVPMCG